MDYFTFKKKKWKEEIEANPFIYETVVPTDFEGEKEIIKQEEWLIADDNFMPHLWIARHFYNNQPYEAKNVLKKVYLDEETLIDFKFDLERPKEPRQLMKKKDEDELDKISQWITLHDLGNKKVMFEYQFKIS